MDLFEEIAQKYDVIYHKLNSLEKLVKAVTIAVLCVAPFSLIFALYGSIPACYAMIALGIVLIVVCGILQRAIAKERHKTINDECREYEELKHKMTLRSFGVLPID